MQQTKKPVEQSVVWRQYAGDREAISRQIAEDSFPTQWGPREVVTAYIMAQMPEGDTWRGSIRVTGYRTPVNDKGTGTAYVSVHWEPEGKVL